MRSGTKVPVGIALVMGLGAWLVVSGPSYGGDDQGLFRRIFRGGSPSSSSSSSKAPAPGLATGAGPASPYSGPAPGAAGAANPSASLPLTADSGAPSFGASAPPSSPPPVLSLDPGAYSSPASASPNPAPNSASTPSGPHIRPQPRSSTAATEAEPVVTRIAMGRGDDGKQFGMFMQVYADGTVIDGEGVHRVSPDVLRPVLQAAQSAELFRLKGHCGSPATDYIETVYMTVYQQRLGSLRANSFSFSGNTQGCDPAVQQLHAALETVVSKVSSPNSPPATAAHSGSVPPSAAPSSEITAPPSTILDLGTPSAVPAAPPAPATSGAIPPMPSPTISAGSSPGAPPLTLSPAPPTR